jgi:hypothetical protein
MLYAGASFGPRVLQKHRWSSRKLVLQPPSPEYPSTIRCCLPRRVRRHRPPYLSLIKKVYLLFPRLILVDSTRAGKRLPDALSKTVPIWCAVINRAIPLRGGCFEVPLPSSSSSDVAMVADMDLDLHTPPGTVSPHEHAQITARLDIWAAALAVSYVPPYFSVPVASSPVHAHRTRRMHSLNWLSRCALCGLRPLRRAFLTSRRTLRSCPLYA